MAALSRTDVAEMIKTALTEFEQRVGSHMQAMQAGHVWLIKPEPALQHWPTEPARSS